MAELREKSEKSQACLHPYKYHHWHFIMQWLGWGRAVIISTTRVMFSPPSICLFVSWLVCLSARLPETLKRRKLWKLYILIFIWNRSTHSFLSSAVLQFAWSHMTWKLLKTMRLYPPFKREFIDGPSVKALWQLLRVRYIQRECLSNTQPKTYFTAVYNTCFLITRLEKFKGKSKD